MATKNAVAEIDLIGDGTEEFDISFADDVNQDSIIEPQSFGPSFPLLQWVNGSPANAKLKDEIEYQGGFFFVTESHPKDPKRKMGDEQIAKHKAIAEHLKAAGWKETTYVFRGGDSADGVWSRQAALSLWDMRQAWVVNVNGEDKYFPWDSYKAAEAAAETGKKPSSKTHGLVLIKGATEAGTFQVTMSGNTGKWFDAALKDFANSVLKAANNASAEAAKKDSREPSRWAPRCFWLPIGAYRNPDGTPKFESVGSGEDTSHISPPVALGLPDASNADAWKRFYVGKPLQDQTGKLYEDNAEWRDAWKNFDDFNNSTPAAHTNGTGPKTAAAEVKANEDALKDLGL